MAVATSTLTFRDAIREALKVEMERDPTVVLMGEDVAGGATIREVETVRPAIVEPELADERCHRQVEGPRDEHLTQPLRA